MLRFCNQAPSCPLAFIFHFVDGLIKNILDDKLQISNNINVQLVDKEFQTNKKESKVKNQFLRKNSLVRALMELK